MTFLSRHTCVRVPIREFLLLKEFQQRIFGRETYQVCSVGQSCHVDRIETFPFTFWGCLLSGTWRT